MVSQGKQQEAQEKFKKALFYNPRNVVALYLWAILDIEMEKYKQAKEKLSAVLSFQPQNADALFYMAFIFYKEKNYILAIDFTKSALELNKENPQIYGLLADSYTLSDQYEKASDIYEQADKKHFKNEKLYNSWGHNAYLNQDFEKSIYAYKSLLRINKNSVDGKYGLAMNFIVKENYDDAKKLLLEVKDVQPDNADVFINLSIIEEIEDNCVLSIEYLEKAIKLDVKNTKFYYDLGRKYEKIGDIEKAKNSYLQMIEYKTENPQVYYHYAKLLLNDNPKEALRKIRKAYNSERENENFVKVYAWAFFNNEQYKNSIDVINKFYKDTIYDLKMFYLKIEALLKLNNFEEVIKSLYNLSQEKKDNEDFDYYLLWAYKIRAKKTNFQNDVNEMNDFAYYLSQKYSQNDIFMVKLNELDEKLN